MELLSEYHIEGLFVGLCTFIIIGVYHPLVIKGEYYFGAKIKWWFLLAGILFLIGSLAIDNIVWSALLGVASFSSFWSIKEVNEQVERVKKGWFPANPERVEKEKKENLTKRNLQ